MASSGSSSARASSTRLEAFLSHMYFSLMVLSTSVVSIPVRPILSKVSAYVGKDSLILSSLVGCLSIHFEPQAASARRTLMASFDDMVCRKLVLSSRLSSAFFTAPSRSVILALFLTSEKGWSYTILPSLKTVRSTSPFTPVRNSSLLIGCASSISPFSLYLPRLRSTPAASRITGGLPGYDFLPPAMGSLPIEKHLSPTYMAQHLKATESESRLTFCSRPPPEPKCTVFAQKPLARRLASMSPTESRATPSPCSTRNCCPTKRRNGLPFLTSWPSAITLILICWTTLSYLSFSLSSLKGLTSGFMSACQCSGRAWRRMVRSCGSVSTPSPESGRTSVRMPPSSLCLSMARIDSPPFEVSLLGHRQATAFQMLKPSLTSETQKELMYCLIMFVKALYSAAS
mmetsp:Transcript_5894/g.14964  ORF Transcript_5894/g.14964 Transcript_5894/m.14964 type:complete len:401 (+) Transcript_5894:359-1561(+)